jgi:hypothetical protein
MVVLINTAIGAGFLTFFQRNPKPTNVGQA